jgi:hypothetical protein
VQFEVMQPTPHEELVQELLHKFLLSQVGEITVVFDELLVFVCVVTLVVMQLG